jgi:adenosylmethionine-8-amino-7-oxononanoate aminotransferase
MSGLFYKNPKTEPTLLVGGEGIYLVGADGRRYLDTCGGVAVSSLGHNHPRIMAAMQKQAGVLSYAHAGSFTTAAAEELADFLTRRSPGLSRCTFLSGGSELVELCMRTAYQYHVETGAPERTRFVSRRQSFHGSTLATLAVTGNPQRRAIFEPLLGPSHHVSPCYAYRDRREGETDAAYAARLAAELEAKFLELGPDTVAAFVAETVVGSTSGAVPPVEGYFAAIRAVCDTYGVLLILDEIMAGTGRTGHLFACSEDGVEPDILALGKGLGAGYVPISAMLVTERVHDAIAEGSGVLRNGQTFVNHPLACAAALEVQQTIEDEELLANVRERGTQLRTRLGDLLGEHPNVGDIRGRGLFLGIEFVADRATKEPLPTSADTAVSLKRRAQEHDLMIYPLSGTIDGVRGDHVLLAPPFICTPEDIDLIAETFAEVVGEVVGEQPAGS